ncbi:MAG: glycolate oxidase subunit GlcE [Gammaproteobacteria bacterium]
MSDQLEQMQAFVSQAYAEKQPIAITGSGSKAFYGGQSSGRKLDTTRHSGILSYEPSELVITARAGTPLAEIETVLREHKQMLAFEPPHFGPAATLGGSIACGFSGPRRATAGAARDFLLGANIINGKGQYCRFGGQVMKNVAGYDLSRLMAGSLGTLGVIMEVSLKVLPIPACELTQQFEISAEGAIRQLQHWANNNYPISASCHVDNILTARFSGGESRVMEGIDKTGGETLKTADDFWLSIREQTHPFFVQTEPLWRISLPPATLSATPTRCLTEWLGGLRWIFSNQDNDKVFNENTMSYSILFRNNNNIKPNMIPDSLMPLHSRIKHAFDPAGILNPGKLTDQY